MHSARVPDDICTTCKRTMDFFINFPSAYVIWLIPFFSYCVTLNYTTVYVQYAKGTTLDLQCRYLKKYVPHLFHFLDNDYLHDKLQFCSKIWNPNFSLHRHFNDFLYKKNIQVEWRIPTLASPNFSWSQFHS